MNKALDRYVPKNLSTYSSLTIPFHPEKILETSVLSKEIEELRIKIIDLEDRLELLKDADQIITHLEKFKKQFYLHCIVEAKNISILRCASMQSLRFCSMRKICKGRLALGKKLKYI